MRDWEKITRWIVFTLGMILIFVIIPFTILRRGL